MTISRSFTWGYTIFLGLAVAMPLFYLTGATPSITGPALPLDDSYIHLDFARNLGTGHGLGFNPDIPSAGTTSPLWVLILAIPAAAGLPLAWCAVVLGWLAYISIGLGLALIGHKVGQETSGLWDWLPSWLWAVMGPVIFLALSGMETMWSVALGLAAIHWRRNVWFAGLLLGLATLLRMENLLLLPIIMLLRSLDQKKLIRLKEALILTVLAILPLIPILIRNAILTGAIYPATWQGKRWFMGYTGINLFAPINIFAYWLDYSDYQLWGILGRETLLLHLLPLNLLALAALFLLSWLGIKNPTYRDISGVLLWSLGLFIAYGLMLPNLGGAGRYVAPVWLALAMGLGWGLRWLALRWHRGRVVVAIMGLLCLGSWGEGAWQWREIYDSAGDHLAAVHLRAAEWCRDNLRNPDGGYPTLAAFDIGALKYVYPGHIVDIGGLNEPAILPFLEMGDIRPFLRLRGVEYLAMVHNIQPQNDLTERMGLVGDGVKDLELVQLAPPFAYPYPKLMRHWPATGNAFPIMIISRIHWMDPAGP